MERQKKIVTEEEDVIEILGDEVIDISEKRKEKKKSIMASTEKIPYTPDSRREMYLEMAEQKEEEEARRRENQPKERNTQLEHEKRVRETRQLEESNGLIRQCNEGKWEFRLRDDILNIILEVDLPRFLDTSLVDVDVHPSYVSIVAKKQGFPS